MDHPCKSLLVAVSLCAAAHVGIGARTPIAPSDTTALLWRDPGPVSELDLYWGTGSEGRAPKPPFRFVSEDTSGTKPKINVTDADGVEWSVKLPGLEAGKNEVHAEIAATRLVWALGYFADENYFVPSGRIEGHQPLKRASPNLDAGGNFQTARFERRPAEAEVRGRWDIDQNRFRGTRELAGLHMLMMLLGSWDLTPHNLVILRVPMGEQAEDRYLVSDLGSTFGRMRGGIGRGSSRWNIQDYRDERIFGGIVQGRFVFSYPLMGSEPLAVSLHHARWFTGLATSLRAHQIRQAFEAAGASAVEAEAFSAALSGRLGQLHRLVTSAQGTPLWLAP